MNDGNRIWSIVPVKRFAVAKSRLSPVLDGEERAALARLMFEDVLDALLQSNAVLGGVAVVTSDNTAATLARSRGATVVLDRDDNGINGAVRLAIGQIAGEDDGIIVVPSDIPQLTPLAIAAVVQAVALPRTMAIAAAADDGGTNLLAGRPAGAIPLRFGRRSFERHYRAATRAGLTVQTLHLPELLLDIDRPEDLRRFVALESRTRTHEFLSWPGIRGRLERREGIPRPAVDCIAAGASS
jgi:2-phospho-L-lactate/phosphoenolpyruvate guanylyltransferase